MEMFICGILFCICLAVETFTRTLYYKGGKSGDLDFVIYIVSTFDMAAFAAAICIVVYVYSH